jgi:hypothetical protein
MSQSISDNRFIREWQERHDNGYCHLGLITADRLRSGKSYAAIRLGELLDPSFSIDENVGFEALWYMKKAMSSPKGTVLVLDEPNRAIGNRSWYTEENQIFANYLQTNAYRQVHGLFALPHEHLMDNAVTAVCTFQIVMNGPGLGACFIYKRDQLNRTYKTRTYSWGQPLSFAKPSAKLVNAYERKRDEYTTMKNLEMVKRIEESQAVQRQPTAKDIITQVYEKYDDYLKNGKLDIEKLRMDYGIGKDKAYHIRNQVEYRRRVSSLSTTTP